MFVSCGFNSSHFFLDKKVEQKVKAQSMNCGGGVGFLFQQYRHRVCVHRASSSSCFFSHVYLVLSSQSNESFCQLKNKTDGACTVRSTGFVASIQVLPSRFCTPLRFAGVMPVLVQCGRRMVVHPLR